MYVRPFCLICPFSNIRNKPCKPCKDNRYRKEMNHIDVDDITLMVSVKSLFYQGPC